MIFILRLIIFSFLIFLGFHFSLRSKKERAAVSVIYGFVLIFYTFLIRVRLTVNVSADDYGHAITTQRSTFQQIWQLLQAIFGMDSSGHLAGVYWQAFILNSYLFIPLGFLVYLWLLCGDSAVLGSTVGGEARDVITDGNSSRVKDTEPAEERRIYLAKTALKTETICIATSLAIEVTQEITHLGMFDINDILANSIGSCIGVGMVWLWQHFLLRDAKNEKIMSRCENRGPSREMILWPFT